MRSSVLAALSAVVVLSSAVVAQTQPPAGGRGRGGGRANAISIPDGGECPPGTTEIRPRSCMAPEFPAPSILDYRPKSQLVAPEHLVKTAKYPAIDFHGHP